MESADASLDDCVSAQSAVERDISKRFTNFLLSTTEKVASFGATLGFQAFEEEKGAALEQELPEMLKEVILTVFTAMDIDEDGRITRTELRHALGIETSDAPHDAPESPRASPALDAGITHTHHILESDAQTDQCSLSFEDFLALCSPWGCDLDLHDEEAVRRRCAEARSFFSAVLSFSPRQSSGSPNLHKVYPVVDVSSGDWSSAVMSTLDELYAGWCRQRPLSHSSLWFLSEVIIDGLLDDLHCDQDVI